MADQEVIKHTKKVFKIWSSDEHSFFHKLQEFFIEIVIIVFAVSLSIWLHDKSEHRHQEKEVKEFLLGLKEDLANDMEEMKNDKESFFNQHQAFKYITSVKLNQALNSDSLLKHQNWIFNTTGLVQNNGRFEGFKSSGKIGVIEDKKLQNNIMDLYQEDIPNLLGSTDLYNSNKNQLNIFCMKNRKRITDSTTNLATILVTDEAQNICASLMKTSLIIWRYNVCIEKMKTIVSQIDSKYKE